MVVTPLPMVTVVRLVQSSKGSTTPISQFAFSVKDVSPVQSKNVPFQSAVTLDGIVNDLILVQPAKARALIQVNPLGKLMLVMPVHAWNA